MKYETMTIKNELDDIFEEVERCKDSGLSVDRKDIEFIFKPDKGIKNKQLQKQLFPNIELPRLCDCIIQKDNLILVELKGEKITNSVLKIVIEKLSNVGQILKEKNIYFSRAVLIYNDLESNKLKQLMSKKIILNKRLEYYKFENQAITL